MLELIVKFHPQTVMDNYYPDIPGIGGYRIYIVRAGKIAEPY